MLTIWNRLREYGSLGIRKAPAVNGQNQGHFILFLREGPIFGQEESDFKRFAKLLDVDPQSREFPITYGLVPEKPNDIAVLTGSVWEIMLNMSWQFEVPPEHIQSGRTAVIFQSARKGGVAPIEVRYSDQEPDGAFVTVYEYGYWFYIDQHDRKSKDDWQLYDLAKDPAILRKTQQRLRIYQSSSQNSEKR